ncbi:MAG TPA: molybdopterin-dependent oxidoreductase [Candidatus Eisenbacteria bacterium]|jgi:molybdopterin-containing oxidoreductase family iron-sulfur binding subunit
MSDSFVFDRRDFLKLVGIGAAGAASGCSAPAEKLIPYLVAPADILPGVPYWYASTCRECPAGCGVLVKAREGRAIKIEGNPDHPVNAGGLCPRGQASLQGLYDPDRLRSPMVRENGAWKAIGWDEALKLAGEKLGEAVRAKRGVALVTDNATGSLHELAAAWAGSAGATHLTYEPFAHESLREANRRTFGQDAIPHYDFAAARMIVSFGADFLETWLSPAGYARGFATARGSGRPARFVAVEPRLSLTGANADEWIACRPGAELALALGMSRVILAEQLGHAVPERGALLDALSAFAPEAVEAATDVPAARVTALAREFAGAAPGLAVGGGVAVQSESALALHAAVNLLNYVAGNVGRTVRFDRTPNFDAVASFDEVQRLVAAMAEGKVDALVVQGANPVYAVPGWAGFGAAMEKVLFKVAITPVMDETAEHCDLVLPATHWLETLGDAETVRGVHSLIQPATAKLPMFDARPAGDVFLGLARAAGLRGQWPESWADYLKAQWRPLHARHGAGADFDSFWRGSLQRGGVWEEVSSPAVRWGKTPAFAVAEPKGQGNLALVLYPSPALFDGRGANKPWLQELPDPTTKAVWGSWVEIHPETAAQLGIAMGDPVRVETENGNVALPAYLYAGIRKDTVAIPLGQGHTAYGRYARARGVNALALLSPAQDAASGAPAYLSARVRLSKAASAPSLVMTQRDKQQHESGMARVIPLAELSGGGREPHADLDMPRSSTHAAGAGEAAGEEGHVERPSQRKLGTHTEPRLMAPGEKTPAHAVTAFVPEETVRGPRAIPIHEGSYKHAQHRWAMAIDLHSCTGCSACVVACYAENNIPTVGSEMIKRGREMAWIRIERFEEKLAVEGGKAASDVRHVPMMCQHCTSAPCETVCPVYATYHNPEGLNAQVYNRCVGTRYCSNNCPYKVRSFNFFDYSAPEKATFAFPEPLNWQLNPDVTVRSKGVMEKCTMCVQRILEGKGNAKDENRAVRDLEIQTACQQSCPTQAIVFGDLLDPESRVSKLSRAQRAYWALDELNTGPGVTYLKEVELPAGNES